MKRQLLFCSGIILVLISCSESNLVSETSDIYAKGVSFTPNGGMNVEYIDEAGDDETTRNIIEFNNKTIANSNGMDFTNYFINTDTIGIFPSEGDQIPFPLDTLTAPRAAFKFYGTGWDLKKTLYYYAYTPFSRTNFVDAKNIEHINISFYGQIEDSLTGCTDANLLLPDTCMQTEYMYLCSDSASAIGTTDGVIAFTLYRIPGVLRARLRLYNGTTTAAGVVPPTTRLIMAHVVHKNPFTMAGTYNLKEAAYEKKANGAFATVPIYPDPKIGMTNVAGLKIDSCQLDKNSRFLLFMYLPPITATVDSRIYLYDTDWNVYEYKASNAQSLKITSNTITCLNANAFLIGKATPDSIYIYPWNTEKEIINSNWNYK